MEYAVVAIAAPSSPFAVTSIVVSMSMIAIGNGLLFAYIPVKLAAEGFAPWVSGTMLTMMSAGGIAGCLMTGRMVRTVGHARVFASPVALVALSCVGGLTLLVQGFAPIYAAAMGYAKADIALLLLLMQFGMIFVQLPLGWISDRVDRRKVLVLACVILITGAAAATRTSGADLFWLIIIFALWAGGAETIYSVATAHANDRSDPRYYVSLSSTLLIAWSVSGFLLPGLATALTPVLGPKAFMFVTILVAVGFAGFVVWRVLQREPVPDDETEPYQAISAQAPHTPEFAPQPSNY
jgi:MFS family permease